LPGDRERSLRKSDGAKHQKKQDHGKPKPSAPQSTIPLVPFSVASDCARLVAAFQRSLGDDFFLVSVVNVTGSGSCTKRPRSVRMDQSSMMGKRRNRTRLPEMVSNAPEPSAASPD
jgi:hypothetical protein